jgi:hypothetical protein
MQPFIVALKVRFPAVLGMSFVAWNELNQLLGREGSLRCVWVRVCISLYFSSLPLFPVLPPSALMISCVGFLLLAPSLLLDYMHCGVVCALSFQLYVLRWFSPFPTFLNEILNVASLGCFHPFMVAREAESHLREKGEEKGVGTFIIRYSSRNPGTS